MKSTQQEIYDAIKGFVANGNDSPTIRKIARRAGVSWITAQRQLSALENAGVIAREKRGSRYRYEIMEAENE